MHSRCAKVLEQSSVKDPRAWHGGVCLANGNAKYNRNAKWHLNKPSECKGTCI